MRITVAAAGRLRAGPEKALADHFANRITAWPVELREVEAKGRLAGAALKEAEGALILKSCPEGATLVALDEAGETLSSRTFAARMSAWQDEGVREVAFAIGGADGLADALRERAALSVSFGRMTWPHFLARGMLFEQLYRAQQIIAGHPYHRD